MEAKSLKGMVGPCGLEPQTSTVSIIYKTAGTAKVRGSRTRHRNLWVGVWVGKTLRSMCDPVSEISRCAFLLQKDSVV